MNRDDPSAFRLLEASDPAACARRDRWLAILTAADWVRIRALSRQVNAAYTPAPLTELSAPLRVMCCPVGQERRHTGEVIGTLRGGRVAVLVREVYGDSSGEAAGLPLTSEPPDREA